MPTSPKTVTGAPAASYELDVTDPGYKFSQVWRTDLAVDRRLPWGVIGTLEGLYSTEVNGAYYTNANLPAAQSAFTGVDKRLRWTSNKLNAAVTNAFVLSNANTGHSYNLSGSLTAAISPAASLPKRRTAYGVSRNSYDPGSTAGSNWGGNAMANDPNNPGVQYSAFSPGTRMFLALSYRAEYFKAGATTISLFTQGQTQGNTNYTFSGDANGDGQSNDLIYIPKDVSEMNFQAYCVTDKGLATNNCALAGAKTFSVADQQAAWDSYINQDPYLKSRRGQYAERNAFFLPILFRSDLGVTQELFHRVAGKRNAVSIRFDILNLDNLLNSKWGSGQRIISTTPLLPQGADANGALLYRLRNVGTDLLSTTYQHTAGTGDVWRMQLGVRYSFGGSTTDR